MGTKQASFNWFLAKHKIFVIFWFFLWIFIWGVTWLIVRARATFVYLFKNSQCILSYDSSSLGAGNVNELWFHLVQEYLQKLSVRFLKSLSICLNQRQTPKAQANLHIRAVPPDPSLFAHIKITHTINEPALQIMVLITQATSESSGEPAHARTHQSIHCSHI